MFDASTGERLASGPGDPRDRWPRDGLVLPRSLRKIWFLWEMDLTFHFFFYTAHSALFHRVRSIKIARFKIFRSHARSAVAERRAGISAELRSELRISRARDGELLCLFPPRETSFSPRLPKRLRMDTIARCTERTNKQTPGRKARYKDREGLREAPPSRSKLG